MLVSEKIPELLHRVQSAYSNLQDPQGGPQPVTDMEVVDACAAALTNITGGADTGGATPAARAAAPSTGAAASTAPGAGGATAGAGGASGADAGGEWQPDDRVVTRAVAMLLGDAGVPQLLWFGSKGTKGAIKVTEDRKNIVLFDYKYPAQRKKPKFPDVSIPIASVTIIEPGVPAGLKKKKFGKKPVVDRSLLVKNGDEVLGHVQSETTGERTVLEAALRKLCIG